MKKGITSKSLPTRLIQWVMGGSLLLAFALPVWSSDFPPLTTQDFIAPGDFTQGFGDRQNGWAWCMKWFKGRLYVGTNRAFHCVERKSLEAFYPFIFRYPPPDPDIECTPDADDLPLQAEIWRWTPQTNIWERVFQSPEDLENPDTPGKYLARDIGFRGMSIYTELDGTKALYVSGVSAKSLHTDDVLPARILRTTDGEHFEALPQDPGTLLHDINVATFRSSVSYKGRFYIIGGNIRGDGMLLEAENPTGGNDNFRVVTPSGWTMFEVAVFNGYLYLGLSGDNGYSVVKTDASGEPPYQFVPVVTEGGHATLLPNKDVLSMQVFDGRLYVGGNGMYTGGGAELIRINPDDTWDLVVGMGRPTPTGWKLPISWMGSGFNWPLNKHAWRMEVYDGRLYIGTFDLSTTYKDYPTFAPLVEAQMGFDFFYSPDGVYFYEIDRSGFGDIFNFGIRSLEGTPYGLFLGTANYYYGLQIWRGVPPGSSVDANPVIPSARPKRLQVEKTANGFLLCWNRAPGALRYSIVRFDGNGAGSLARNVEPVIGTTEETFYKDETADPGRQYTYCVQGEDESGNLSESSNWVSTISSTAGIITFDYVRQNILRLEELKMFVSAGGKKRVWELFEKAQENWETGDVKQAKRFIENLHQLIKENTWGELDKPILKRTAASDLDILISRFLKRIILVNEGLLVPSDL